MLRERMKTFRCAWCANLFFTHRYAYVECLTLVAYFVGTASAIIHTAYCIRSVDLHYFFRNIKFNKVTN